MWSPFPHVTTVRSPPPLRCVNAAPTGTCSPLTGPSQSSSPSSWRSRVWYSAIGSRKTQTLPSAFAAATHVRSIAAASTGRAGDAITSPGTSRRTPSALSLWK